MIILNKIMALIPYISMFTKTYTVLLGLVNHSIRALILAILFTSLFQLTASACIMPAYGDKYDALISVKKLTEEDRFYISFPYNVDDPKNKPEVLLNYVSHATQENCIEGEEIETGVYISCAPIDHYHKKLYLINWKIFLKQLSLNKENMKIEGEIKVPQKQGYKTYIEVSWSKNNGFCPSIGKKNIFD